MHRGWMDHEFFRRERFSKAQAWCWLIENADWSTGTLDVTYRQLAERWKWSLDTVNRYLKALQKRGMIRTQTERRYTIVTVENYKKYQGSIDQPPNADRNSNRTQIERKPNTYKEVRSKETTRGGAGAPPKWSGRILRLNEVDYHRWRKTYHAIPDFDAELQAADDYYFENPPRDGKWFFPVSRWLKKAHDDAYAEQNINYKNF